MRPDLVIFDCDGVLVDSELLAAGVLAAYITELGRPTEARECLAAFTGISIASVAEKLKREWNVILPDGFVEELRKRDRETFEAELKAVPGADQAVRAVKAAGVMVCVASSGAKEKFTHTLSLTGLLHHFEGNLFSATEVPRGKPAPDLFLYAASEMGVKPERCLVVEDSAAGVQAAIAAGMRVVGFAGGSHASGGYAVKLMNAGADEVILDLSSIPSMLS